MPPKKINKPKTKHTEFATMQFRLAGDDWLIAIWNRHNRQACYFLAEPSEVDPKDKKRALGYFVSSLEREGIARSVFPSLPRLFKTTDKAVDWLEDQIEGYAGDEFVPALPAGAEPAVARVAPEGLARMEAKRTLSKVARERAANTAEDEILFEAATLASDLEARMRAL